MSGSGSAPYVVLRTSTFSPRDLFIGGTDGVWFDPSDTGTLFQTSTATTLVGTSGDPVGYMVDKSGNGHDAVRVIDDTHRPTWQQTSGGLTYLQGTAAATGGPGFTLTNGLGIARNKNVMSAIVGLRLDAVNDPNGQNVFSFSIGGSNVARFTMYQPASTAVISQRCRRLDTDGGVDITGAMTLTAGVDLVAYVEANYGEQFGISLQEYTRTSLYGAGGGFPSSTAGPTDNTDGAQAVLMCGDTGAAASSLGGRIYGLVVLARQLSQGERQQAIRFMSGKVKGRFN